MSENKTFTTIYGDVLTPRAMITAEIILALLEELELGQRAKVLVSVIEFVNLE